MTQSAPTTRRRRRYATLLAVMAVALLNAACSSSGAASAPSVTGTSDAAAPLLFAAADYTITPPATVTGGEVTISLHNRGTEEHQLSLFRLGDGQHPNAVLNSLDKGDLSFLAGGALVGGPNAVEPGQTASVTSKLDPGTYVAFSAVPSPTDHRPHFTKGMRTSFTVLPAAAQVTIPSTAGTIAITARGFQPSPGFTGRGTYAVTNDAPFPAELSILRIATGKTTDDAVAFLAGHAAPGPPPFSAAGGVTAMSPSSTSYVNLSLDPGTYAFLSFAPDPRAGFAPQYTNGMLSTIRVP